MLFLAIHQVGFGLVSRHKFWLNFPSTSCFCSKGTTFIPLRRLRYYVSSSRSSDDAYCFTGYNLKAPGTWQIELVPLSITLHLGWWSKVLPSGPVVTLEQSFCNIVISAAGYCCVRFCSVSTEYGSSELAASNSCS